MSKELQIYYTALLGALGGLLGWWIIGSVPNRLSDALIGTGLGLCISGCVATTDGALIKRVRARALRDGLKGAAAGALAGLLGLLLAGALFVQLGGGFVGRMLGWMLLGGLIGFADMLVSRQTRKALYGALGGLLGGAFGGGLYEGLTQLFRAQSDRAQIVVGGVGLMLLGACVGALIPLARQVLSRGELRVLNGDQAGLVREITDTATIGRYDGCDVYLPDGTVSWRHARIRRTAHGFAVEVLADARNGALVGERRLGPGESTPLRDGERIALGETWLEFTGR